MARVEGLRRELARVRAAQARLARAWTWEESRLARVPAGSRWSVGEHLEHVARAEVDVLDLVARLAEGRAGEERGAPTLAGRAVLLTRWIPRGRGRSPERVQPRAAPAAERRHSMERLLARAAGLAELLERGPEHIASARGKLPHPALGSFDARQWLRFGPIHAEHHLRIVGG